MLQDDTHSLGLRAEWKVGEDLIFLLLAGRILYLHLKLLSFKQRHPEAICELYESHFIWGRCLELLYRRVILVGEHRRDIMAETEC